MANISKQIEKKYNDVQQQAQNKYIDMTSLSQKDIQSIIDNLIKNVGTQVSQNQNYLNDTLFDAPEATKIAAARGAQLSGNTAIANAIPQIKLEGEKSRKAAASNWYNLQLQQQQFKQQQELNQQQSYNQMFSDIGGLLAMFI